LAWIRVNGSRRYFVDIARSNLDIILGLSFKREESFTRPLVFDFQKNGDWKIHSRWVFFDFDGIFVNEDRKVIDILRTIHPWESFITPKSFFRYLVEKPVLFPLRFTIGDIITFDFSEGK
jgi:uncharacterized membrane protein (UPF0127 family)